jgi:RNA polymerase sigma-70 factor (ECF subfamily)
MERHELDPEDLLAHAAWMRALAFNLLKDPAAADDVVQDAAIAALRHPPERGVALEAWLSRVVRNFAWRWRRSETRRADHEARATLEPRDPGPSETLERLDTQRVLLDAVRSLDEPFRTAVVQHYFEGRNSSAIALSLGVPPSTVRWRLKRGLEQLRERLDARTGSRECWTALLAPFAVREGGAIASSASSAGSHAAPATKSILQGALAMSTTQVAMTAAALAIAAGVVWWSFDAPGSSAAPNTVALAPREPAPDAPEPIANAAVDSAERTAARELDAQPAKAAAALAATTNDITAEAPLTGRIDARFVDEHGAPWSGVRFAPLPIAWMANWKPNESAVSGPDGRVDLEIVLPRSRINRGGLGEVHVDFVASRSGCATIARQALLQPGHTAHLGDVVLGPGVRVDGRVVDENGEPIAGATVGVAAAVLTADQGRMHRLGCDEFDAATSVRSSDSGAFVLEGVAVGSVRLWAHIENRRYTWTEPFEVAPERDVHEVVLALVPLLATDRIDGRVVQPDGAPMPRAEVRYFVHAGDHSTATSMYADEQGHFRLIHEYDDSICDFTAIDNEHRFASTTVKDVRPGTLDLVIRMDPKRMLAVHLRDKDGRAVEGAKIDIEQRAFEEPAATTVTGAGDYDISIPGDDFTLVIEAPGFRSERRSKLNAATLGTVLEITLRRAPVVRGRVVAAGEPVAGVHVRIARHDASAGGTVDGFRYQYIAQDFTAPATTDARGRFEMTCDMDGEFWLRASVEGWAPAELGRSIRRSSRPAGTSRSS